MGDTVIIRHRSERNFTVLDNSQIRDSRLSWKARGLVAYLLSLPEGWQLRIAQLVEQAPDGRCSTRAGLAELQKIGYLTIERERNPRGRFERTTWTITQTPRSFSSPICDKEQTSRPRSENRIVEQSHHKPENQIPVKRTGTTEVPSLRSTTTGEPDGLIFPSLSESEHRAVGGEIQKFDHQTAQALLDELAGAMAHRRIKTTRVSYLRGIAKNAKCGAFTPDLGLSVAAERNRRREEDFQRNARRAEDEARQKERNSDSSRAAFEQCLTTCSQTLGVPSELPSPCPSGTGGHQGDPAHASLRAGAPWAQSPGRGS